MTVSPPRFEDRLLDELRRVVAEREAPRAAAHRRPFRTRPAFAGVAVAAAAATVAIVATSGSPQPAYAVQSRADGSVTVQIRSLDDAAGLESSLRRAGIPAVVEYGCYAPAPRPAQGGEERGVTKAAGGADPSTNVSGRPGTPHGSVTMSRVARGPDGVSFTLDPGALRPGEMVYIATSGGTMSTLGMAISDRPPASSCP